MKMRSLILTAAVCAAAVTAGAGSASATMVPWCTDGGTDLRWYGFSPGPHDVTYSVDGIVPTTKVTVRNGSVTRLLIPGAPWQRVTIRERWGPHPDEAITYETFLRCVWPEPAPPVKPPTTPPVTPPTAPEPPDDASQQPPAEPTPAVLVPTPVLPGPDNPCPAAIRNVYRHGAGARWVREAIARGCVKPRPVKRCPYRSRVVIVPVTTKDGETIKRRVRLCIPRPRPVAVTG